MPDTQLKWEGDADSRNTGSGLTWDQTQFERLSYILSNGYRCRFALPAGMLLQSETKIEPDLRLAAVLKMSKDQGKYLRNEGYDFNCSLHWCTFLFWAPEKSLLFETGVRGAFCKKLLRWRASSSNQLVPFSEKKINTRTTLFTLAHETAPQVRGGFEKKHRLPSLPFSHFRFPISLFRFKRVPSHAIP